MISILNGATWAGLGLSYILNRFGKNCLIPMILSFISQLILLAFVVCIWWLMRNDVNTAAIILDITSTPLEFFSLVSSLATS